MDRLRERAEPGQALARPDCHIGKNYVGERVLSEKRSLLDVDQDAAEERDQHAHPVRLAQCPEEECDRDKIRHPGRAVQHEVEQDAHQNGGADPERIRRLQDVLPGLRGNGGRRGRREERIPETHGSSSFGALLCGASGFGVSPA